RRGDVARVVNAVERVRVLGELYPRLVERLALADVKLLPAGTTVGAVEQLGHVRRDVQVARAERTDGRRKQRPTAAGPHRQPLVRQSWGQPVFEDREAGAGPDGGARFRPQPAVDVGGRHDKKSPARAGWAGGTRGRAVFKGGGADGGSTSGRAVPSTTVTRDSEI